jgi:hypothetical protein
MNWQTFWMAIRAIASVIGLIKFKSLKSWIFIIWRRFFKYCRRLSLKLVRDKENPDRVYAIFGNKRQLIKDEKTLFELGYKQDDVKEISKEELDQYKEDKPIKIEKR